MPGFDFLNTGEFKKMPSSSWLEPFGRRRDEDADERQDCSRYQISKGHAIKRNSDFFTDLCASFPPVRRVFVSGLFHLKQNMFHCRIMQPTDLIFLRHSHRAPIPAASGSNTRYSLRLTSGNSRPAVRYRERVARTIADMTPWHRQTFRKDEHNA